MDLKRQGDIYSLTFEHADRRPVAEACRENIVLIATNDYHSQTGETVHTADGAETLELLARIAIHARTKKDAPLPLEAEELKDFEVALRQFGATGFTKRAIEAESRRAGVLSNPHIEVRFDLGRRALAIANELTAKKSALDNDSAPQTLVA